MRGRTWIVCLVLIAVPGLLPLSAAETEQRPPSVLEAVAALDKRVTYTVARTRLGELVQKVAQETGAALTAARDAADGPVTVVVSELPARELLEHLAGLLDYR
jgi:hypothetical protein